MSSPLILVVDDEPLLVMALEDHLVDAGFAVVTACSVEQAMRRLDEHSRSIHALVTDVRMPGGQNGWDLARMARERDPSLVVMYLTCDSVDEWPSRGVPSSQVLGKTCKTETWRNATSRLRDRETGLAAIRTAAPRSGASIGRNFRMEPAQAFL